MASSERLATIVKVRAALDAVEEVENLDNLSETQERNLDTAWTKLRLIEGRLIFTEINQRLQIAETHRETLRGVSRSMKRSIKELKSVGKKIDEAVSAVEKMIDLAAGIAASGTALILGSFPSPGPGSP